MRLIFDTVNDAWKFEGVLKTRQDHDFFNARMWQIQKFVKSLSRSLFFV